MSLSNLIRGKNEPARFATATPATLATPERESGRTVASVAKLPKEKTALLTDDEEQAILAWLAHIGEADQEIIGDVLSQCQHDAVARAYFLGRTEEVPQPLPDDDDRRTCGQCANLIARRCQAAKRGEIVASRSYEPIRDLPRRCEGYVPGADDPDRRHGRERWPGLIQTSPVGGVGA